VIKSGVKGRRSTVGMPWILVIWSVGEVDGIGGVAVKCIDIAKNTGGEDGRLAYN
jgi:hypothetical protein